MAGSSNFLGLKHISALDASLDLFSTEEERQAAGKPRILDIPLSEIDDFPDHPFKVLMNEDMDQLITSIRENGLITPVTLRKKADGRYVIISGHRRRKACSILGYETIKAEIRELTDDEAVILMVDSNCQRTAILPSEKARAYKMKMDALKRQGKRTDLTSVPLGPKLENPTATEVGRANGDSASQVKRYIRLNELNDGLLYLTDKGMIPFQAAVELSFLTEQEQNALYKLVGITGCCPSKEAAVKMKELSQRGELSEKAIESIMINTEKKQKTSFSYKTAKQYIPESVPIEEYEGYILQALRFYIEHEHDAP